MARSLKHGKRISDVEILNISGFGIWILVKGSEYFINFDEFPWFKESSVAEICKVELHHNEHLYWPQLDIDLSVESLKYPERFPLKARLKT